MGKGEGEGEGKVYFSFPAPHPLRHSRILAPILPVSSESKMAAEHSKDENHQNRLHCRLDKYWIAHSKQVLSMFNGSKMETIGKRRINLVNPKVDEECEAQFVVVNKDSTPLLGSKTVQEMKLIELRYENISLVQEKPEAMGLTM